MTFKSDLFKYLTTHPAVSSLIGFDASARLRAGKRRDSDKKLDAIIYIVSSTQNDEHLGGPTDIETTTLQYDCYSTSMGGSDAMSAALYKALAGFHGEMFETDVISCSQVGHFDNYDDPDDGTEKGMFRVQQEFEFKHRRSVPAFA